MSDGFRIEKDSLGEMKVPEGALYGAPVSYTHLTLPTILLV